MASDPRMKRYFHRSLSLAAIGLATSHVVAWGNDNFILQPKIQSSQAATAEVTTQSFNGKPQATASAVTPTAATPAAQQISQPAPQNQAIRSSSVVAQPSLLQPQSPNAAAVGQANQSDASRNSQSNFAQPITEIHSNIQPAAVAANAGPSWVKRSSREQIVAQSNTAQSNAGQLATRQSGQYASGVSFSAQNAAQPNWNSTLPHSNANEQGFRVVQSGRPDQQSTLQQSTVQQSTAPQSMAFPKESTFVQVESMNVGSSNRYVPSLGYVPPAGPAQSVPAQSDDSQSDASPGVAAQLASTDRESRSNTEGKMHLASRLSKSIIGEPAEKKFVLSGGSSMVGPAAVGQQLSTLLANSEQLSRRGLFLSAREDAGMAQLRLARFLDSLSNNYRSEPALKAAQTALREAADFSQSRTAEILPELINSHETPVLKSVEIARTPPTTLAQSYYQYAETQLIEGAQQHPWFSDIFYTIGRTYQAEADSISTADRDLLRAQAIVYYRAAVTIRPSNSLATNQLGFVLLQLDRPKEAQVALVASVDSRLEIPALQNLVEASRRLGDQAMQQWAMNAISQLQRQIPPALPNSPEILEVDNNTFRSTAPVVPTSGSPAPLTANSANSGANSASMVR